MMQTVSHVEITLYPVSMLRLGGIIDPPGDTGDPSIRRCHIINTKMMRMFPILNYFGLFRTPQKNLYPVTRGRTQSLYSLLNTVPCPFRCPLTCLVLTSRLSGLERTQHWVRDDKKVDCLTM